MITYVKCNRILYGQIFPDYTKHYSAAEIKQLKHEAEMRGEEVIFMQMGEPEPETLESYLNAVSADE